MKTALAVFVAFLVLPAAAAADGLPLPVDDSTGVVGPSGHLRYVTLPSGHGTAVAALRTDGGAPVRSGFLSGRFTVPAVAYDGSASGLSADGSRLVLITPRRSFPRTRTTLAVLDARTLIRLETVRLEGDFSFDAVSPDGRSLFLINYVAPRDPTQYRVRVYDLDAHRLLRRAIVDPHEDPDEMNGQPITRRTSPDGRWAYTLYMGSEHPFIHALDTSARKAVCVDLPSQPAGMNPFSMGLAVSPGGGELRVLSHARHPLAIVHTGSWKVSGPPVAAEAAGETRDVPWTALILAGAALASIAAAFLVARRVLETRHGAAREPR